MPGQVPRIQEGKETIVLVSHNLDLVKGFGEKALYLMNGEMGGIRSERGSNELYIEDAKRLAWGI